MTPPTDLELEMTGDLIKIVCVACCVVLMAVAVLASVLGTPFIELLYSSFRG